MNRFIVKRKVRALAVRLGVFRPLRALVFLMRGGSQHGEEIKFHRRFLKDGDLAFDVGANRGQSSEVFLDVGARVIAFEPQTDLHAEIRQVCRRNRDLKIIPLGLGSKVEDLTFFIADYDQVASFRDDWEGQRIGEATISVSTLDIQIEQHGVPDYCKIDVEGWEYEVLSGLTRPIPLISFEYHASEKELPKVARILERLQALAPYSCNMKLADTHNFALEAFIPIQEFMEIYEEKAKGFGEGYGDIFCALHPEKIGPV